MTDTETKLAIDIAADISTRPEFAKCESPLVLAIVQAALAAHDAARAQPVRPPDGLDIETIAATLDELGTTDGYDEEDLAWAKRQAGLLRTLANPTQQPSAYCLDCQRAGMRNCQNLDECSGATCVTCHRPLNTPARPTSAMHQQLLDTLGATNQSDAMRIIAEHHARELRAQPDELAGLSAEVREAVSRHSLYMDFPEADVTERAVWNIIRAELLRLAKENADLLSTIDLDEQVWVQRDETMHRWIERARNAEAELAAIKARIAEAPIIHAEKTWRDSLFVSLPQHDVELLDGKRVHLVVEE